MGTKAVLIVGASGFIGTHLALRLRDEYRVFATYHKHAMQMPGVTYIPLDIANRNWIKRAVYTARPDFVIYLTGSGDPIWCEDQAKMAEFLHTGGVATISQAVDILQPKFIYLSSAYAFDGARGNYHETDTVLPDNVLGKSKLAGENIVRTKLNYIVIRSSPLFGRGNGYRLSALDRLRITLQKGQRIELADNEVHSFAPVQGLVELIQRTLTSGIRNKTIHYGGLTKVSHYDFARLFAEHQGYDPRLVLRAARPQINGSAVNLHWDYSLNSTLAADSFKIKPYLLEEAFELLVRQPEPPSDLEKAGFHLKVA
jgi:dTDP-4-dehydrorhamnose reductase